MVDRLTNDPSLGLVGLALVTPAGIFALWASFPDTPSIERPGCPAATIPRTATAVVTERRSARAGIAIAGRRRSVLAVRRGAFEAVGGFHGRYFMYVEEVDLCWRLAGSWVGVQAMTGLRASSI